MKSKIYSIALLLVITLAFSCESDDLAHQDDFVNSKITWLQFKESSYNSYKYTTTFSSWIGTSWETTITVSKGEIVKRHFKYTLTKGLPDDFPEENLEWTENENELGSNGYKHTLLTLDEVYEKAQNEWLKDREQAQIFFETKNNGLISTCGYIEKGCQDDCFIGIKIKSIEAL
ncbi:hypothetical protein [Flavivirga eckloniae]|uniref:DUF4377 domain-containing protein n=1 Tax=Flavivirga eckloniae TaxID=1803846 RepID=A0A2K9PKQ3_9FLAO|nr:hypothetical protein [Flavivirga eckloniae]AUP77643.1 hypothetical protein C1H87_02500 [Flavivirga eckloniae]